MPDQKQYAQFIPGQHTPPGWDIDGDGKADVGLPGFGPHYEGPYAHGYGRNIRQRGAQEIRQLNQYVGYFNTADGDVPVTVVANSIKEASKILTMPGVYGDMEVEPTMIKFLKGKVAVSVPVHHVGFNTVVEPAGALQSGAMATPVHAEVHNGTEVIFTAIEPFGWKFKGWFKGDLCLSTELVAYIDVYDPYSTLVTYVAKYEFDPQLRNGRYISLGEGWLFDFKFDGWGNYDGRLILNANTTGDWHFIMPKDSLDLGKGEIILQTDSAIVQPQDIGMTLKFEPTPVGLNLFVVNTTVDNPWGIQADQMIALKWTNAIESGSFNGSF